MALSGAMPFIIQFRSKIMLRLFAGLVLFAGSALADTAYVGATLIDGTGGEAIQDGTLIVSGDGLTYVGPTAAAPLLRPSGIRKTGFEPGCREFESLYPDHLTY